MTSSDFLAFLVSLAAVALLAAVVLDTTLAALVALFLFVLAGLFGTLRPTL